ncbi:MAG TPA: poly-gamma-glutamate synthase PgsB [bacterium]
MVTIFFILIVFLLFLIYERILVNRWRNSISLRISVTGIRGKSSVVRMIASILREDGRTVLAKTTGSEAKYILPDGSEKDVQRRGIPSILEQKKILKKAVGLGVDCLVVEIMSIHPENHYVESRQILKPNLVVLTNVRIDHPDAMGSTAEQIASVLCLDFPEKAVVFIPEKENRKIFQSTVDLAQGKLISVQTGISDQLEVHNPDSLQTEFSDNMDLVYSVGKFLKIEDKIITAGLSNVRYDIGRLKVWKYPIENTKKICYLVNGFAANDPLSTIEVISKIKAKLPVSGRAFIGLLNLRSDRADRTEQWIHALKNGAADHFSKIYAIGTHANIIKHKLKKLEVIKSKAAKEIMEKIVSGLDDQAVIFGFGNIGGLGRLVIDYWNNQGEDYGI